MTTRSLPLVRLALVAASCHGAVAAQSLLGLHGEAVLSTGEAAPGIPGKTIHPGIKEPVIDQLGSMLFQARLSPAGVDDRALYIGRGNLDLRLVAQSGTQAPGLPAGIHLRSSSTVSGAGLEDDPLLSPTGEIVFFGSRLFDPANPANTPNDADSAFFWGPAAAVTAIAREGDQVPGLPAGVLFGDLMFVRRHLAIRAGGDVVLQCGLLGAVHASNDSVLLAGTPGNLQVVAREGAPVAGGALTWSTAFGNTIANLPAINGAGAILFDCKFAGSAGPLDDRGLAVWQPGSGATVIAREGSQAPGMAAGVQLTGGPGRTNASWNDSGNTLFGWAVADGGATINVDNDTVLFYGGVGGVQKVAQEGDPTGLPGGERLGVFQNNTLVSNAADTIAWMTTLRDANNNPLPSATDTALFVGSVGNPTMVVREGDVIAAIPPSSNGPWVCGSVNGEPNLNARGQLLFLQDASDGVDSVDFLLVHDPVLGLQVARAGNETYTTPVGTGQAVFGFGNALNQSGGADSTLWFNNHGDFALLEFLDGGVDTTIVRGHSGTLVGAPATIAAGGGDAHDFTIDCGVARAGHLYLVLGSLAGSSPGFPSPFGPAHVPLNIDGWLSLSLGLADSIVYPGSLGLLDAAGRTTAASFQLPVGNFGLAGQTLHHAALVFDQTFVHTFSTEPAALKFL